MITECMFAQQGYTQSLTSYLYSIYSFYRNNVICPIFCLLIALKYMTSSLHEIVASIPKESHFTEPVCMIPLGTMHVYSLSTTRILGPHTHKKQHFWCSFIQLMYTCTCMRTCFTYLFYIQHSLCRCRHQEGCC